MTETLTATGFIPPVAPDPELAGLWARAIASDADRPHWLGVRRTRLTGTDMGVVNRGRKQTRAEHFRKKAAGENANIGHQKAVEWGNYREEVLIGAFAGEGWHRCGLLIADPENGRLTSTPDIAGVSFSGDLEIREVKTSEKDLDPAGPDFKATRYMEQILGQLMTTRAERVILTVEQHDGDWTRWGDRPGPGWEFDNGTVLADYGPAIVAVHEWVFERSELVDEIEALRARSVAALAELDAALVGFVEDGPEEFDPVQQREIGVEARRYADGVAAEKHGKAEKAAAQSDLLGMLDGRKAFSERFDGIKVTFSPATVSDDSEDVDEDAAREASPEVWERLQGARAALTAAEDQWVATLSEHMKTVPGKPVPAKVTVTPPRNGGSK